MPPRKPVPAPARTPSRGPARRPARAPARKPAHAASGAQARRPARAAPRPAASPPGLPGFAWLYTGLRVLDLDAALRFFRDGLGMRVRFRFKIKETGGTIVELVSGDGKHFLELNWYPPGSEHATPYEPGEALDHLAFRIRGASLEQAIRHLEAHGGKLRIPPFREGDCMLAYVDSPDGHTIELDAHGAARP